MDSTMIHSVVSMEIRGRERETSNGAPYDTQRITIRKEDGKEVWVTLFFDGKKAKEAILNENQTKHKH